MFTNRVPTGNPKNKTFERAELKRNLEIAPRNAPIPMSKKYIIFGGSYRIRTYDQRVKSPVLYQLS